MLLDRRVHALQQQQQIRRVREQMQLPVALAVEEGEAVRAEELLLFGETRGLVFVPLLPQNGPSPSGDFIRLWERAIHLKRGFAGSTLRAAGGAETPIRGEMEGKTRIIVPPHPAPSHRTRSPARCHTGCTWASQRPW